MRVVKTLATRPTVVAADEEAMTAELTMMP